MPDPVSNTSNPGGSSAPAGGSQSGGSSQSSQSAPDVSQGASHSQGADSGSSSDSGGSSPPTWMDSIFGEGGSQPATAAPGAAAPQEAPPPVVEGQPPVAPAPVAAPVQGQPAAGQPASAAAGSPGEASSQAPRSPQLDPADPITLANGLREHQAAAIEHLASTVFKLEPTDLEALEADVAGTVPKLLARAVVFSQQQFLTQMSRVVPMMIQRHQEMVSRHSTNEDKFFGAWPTIDRAQNGQVVRELGARYRQMFPDATLEQMIEQLGPLVLSHLGLPLTQAARTGAPAAAKAAPKANGASARPQAFVPAAPGGTAQSQQAPEANAFEYMGAFG